VQLVPMQEDNRSPKPCTQDIKFQDLPTQLQVAESENQDITIAGDILMQETDIDVHAAYTMTPPGSITPSNESIHMQPKDLESQSAAVTHAMHTSEPPGTTTSANNPTHIQPEEQESQATVAHAVHTSESAGTTTLASEHCLWRQIWDELPVEAKALFHLTIVDFQDPASNRLLDTLMVAKHICQTRDVVLERGQKRINVRDLADKLICWVQKFVQVGDIIAQYDPAHMALPWAALRFVLQVRTYTMMLFLFRLNSPSEVTLCGDGTCR